MCNAFFLNSLTFKMQSFKNFSYLTHQLSWHLVLPSVLHKIQNRAWNKAPMLSACTHMGFPGAACKPISFCKIELTWANGSNNICSVDVQTFQTSIFSEENLIIGFLWFWIIVRPSSVSIPASSGQPARIVPYKLRAKLSNFLVIWWIRGR